MVILFLVSIFAIFLINASPPGSNHTTPPPRPKSYIIPDPWDDE